MALHDEVPLLGGLSTRGVVQVGDTVRRPIGANADYVHGLLLHLLTEDAVRAGAMLVRDVHDLTQGTPLAAGSEVAAHRNLGAGKQEWPKRCCSTSDGSYWTTLTRANGVWGNWSTWSATLRCSRRVSASRATDFS
jgi:hypothetical protein